MVVPELVSESPLQDGTEAVNGKWTCSCYMSAFIQERCTEAVTPLPEFTHLTHTFRTVLKLQQMLALPVQVDGYPTTSSSGAIRGLGALAAGITYRHLPRVGSPTQVRTLRLPDDSSTSVW